MFSAINAFTPEFLEQSPETLWSHISPHYAVDESPWLKELLEQLNTTVAQNIEITGKATSLIEQVRGSDESMHMIDALLLQYSLDTREGVLLMCLAEALMRIPDAETADALIRDKLSVAQWNDHLSQSDSMLVNASTWGLMLTGKVITLDLKEDGSPANIINRLVNKMGEPLIRQAVNQAMKIMGRHFVLGRTISEAMKNARKPRQQGYSYSFDMLGEAALTAEDAARYHREYLQAIERVGEEPLQSALQGGEEGRPSISIKLSALHPRYEVAQQERVLDELYQSVLELVTAARAHNVALTMDAEEQDRHELFLKLFEKVYQSPACRGWGHYGLVVQAYGKRALPTLCWLYALAREQGDDIPIRLVKGAYWDSEVKLAQENGYSGYPVYTRKEATDVAYLVCSQFLLNEEVQKYLLPQFASHNAHTIASIQVMSHEQSRLEFQRLHGMGDALYKRVLDKDRQSVRIYAPVGSHKDLLPYLVRRLLENGANSSFVHRLVDARTPVNELVQHPADLLKSHQCLANELIPLPEDIFGKVRKNSTGINMDVESVRNTFESDVNGFMSRQWRKGPLVNGEVLETAVSSDIYCPYQNSRVIGRMHWSSEKEVEQALGSASAAWLRWNHTPVEERADVLNRLADLLEQNRPELVALCHREAGKTIHDAIDEIREAVDFCRYYASRGQEQFANPIVMPGPTGESNELALTGRGVFLCISPWNFPLAIFLGQITAALVAGNTVIAKPAEQTSVIAVRAIELMLEAGIPRDVIHVLTGAGSDIGQRLVSDDRIAGVAFTGSTETAKRINRALAERDGPIVPFIAETGGQNAMVVDSTALPEQVVSDVVRSAFGSAGQRCSALRVLYLQEDIADRVIAILRGAMNELTVGNPSLHSTDLGPVIDPAAQERLEAHIQRMQREARLVAESPLPDDRSGYFIAPVAFEIDRISQLEKEHFGPVLHIVRYKASELDRVIADINSTGFGLTLGVHSRNELTSRQIEEGVRAGNVYVNRNQVGAVVGVQPFGGLGLSGTGPKAGGPFYLQRFATERTLTINTTAVGGNATLLSLKSE